MAVRSVRFCSGTLDLEGRLAEPEHPSRGGIALCHPHPQYQGSMSSALIAALQRSFVNAGFVTLRFNFRGVGRSQGRYDHGRGETEDAVAALDFVASCVPVGGPLVSIGWSFGSIVALRAAILHDRVHAAVAIAPPLGRARVRSPEPPTSDVMRAWGRPVLVIAGGRDDISPVAAMREWVEASSAKLVVIADADHFFTESDAVAEQALGFLLEHGVGG